MKHSVLNSAPSHQCSNSVIPSSTLVQHPPSQGWCSEIFIIPALPWPKGPALGGEGHAEPSEETPCGMAEPESIEVGARMPSKAQCYCHCQKCNSSLTSVEWKKYKRKYSSLAKTVNFSSAKWQHCASENCLSLQQGGEREIKMK